MNRDDDWLFSSALLAKWPAGVDGLRAVARAAEGSPGALATLVACKDAAVSAVFAPPRPDDGSDAAFAASGFALGHVAADLLPVLEPFHDFAKALCTLPASRFRSLALEELWRAKNIAGRAFLGWKGSPE